MRANSNIAFKEWAVVVDALGRGEQILILRKGGIHEGRGGFQVEHDRFWLFPTRFHEAEDSVIPSKRPALQEIAVRAAADTVPIEFFAVVEAVAAITGPDKLHALQGRHIWSDHVLRDRFEFGRDRGIHALLTRVYRLSEPQVLPLRPTYGGCKSWVELETALPAENLTPALSDAEFNQQRNAIMELLRDHALAHP